MQKRTTSLSEKSRGFKSGGESRSSACCSAGASNANRSATSILAARPVNRAMAAPLTEAERCSSRRRAGDLRSGDRNSVCDMTQVNRSDDRAFRACSSTSAVSFCFERVASITGKKTRVKVTSPCILLSCQTSEHSSRNFENGTCTTWEAPMIPIAPSTEKQMAKSRAENTWYQKATHSRKAQQQHHGIGCQYIHDA